MGEKKKRNKREKNRLKIENKKERKKNIRAEFLQENDAKQDFTREYNTRVWQSFNKQDICRSIKSA